ncbi:hypothetical protein [Helicobacter sp. T3_23-1056]
MFDKILFVANLAVIVRICIAVIASVAGQRATIHTPIVIAKILAFCEKG